MNPRTLTLLLNDKCPLRCDHCSLGYSDRSATDRRLDNKDLKTVIRALDTNIYDMIVLAGGEPSLVPQLVKVATEECHSVGLLSALATAPIWAASMDSACQFVSEFPYLDFLILSYDRYHLKFLKASNYLYAAEAASSKGIRVALNACYTSESEIQELQQSISHLSHVLCAINWQRIIPIGNAQTLSTVQSDAITLDSIRDFDDIPRSCLVGNGVIDTHRRLHACCWASSVEGSPLQFSEDIRVSTKSSFDSLESDCAVKSLRSCGLIGQLTKDKRIRVLERLHGNSYVNECDLCMSLMSEDCKAIWNELFEWQ